MNRVPQERSDEIAAYLARFVQGNGKNTESIKALLKKAPLILKKEIDEASAQNFIKQLSLFDAEAVFVPKEETSSITQRPLRQRGQDAKVAETKPQAGTAPPSGGPSPEESVGQRKLRESGDPSQTAAQGVAQGEQVSAEKGQEQTKGAKEAKESPFHEEDDPILENLLKDNLAVSKKKKKKCESKLCQRCLARIKEEFYKVNKELWLILSLVSLTAFMNYLVDSQKLFLSLYSLPTVFSAYYFGKRHAVLTAAASILLVIFILYYFPQFFNSTPLLQLDAQGWRDITFWGGTLLIIAYTMGTLYDQHKEKIRELQKTYQGILLILRHFISKDEYTENHCYRVSVYAVKIAQYLGLPEDRIEDLRAAALLHDLGKLKISREILYKAAKLSEQEFEEMKKHVTASKDILDPLQGALGRIIPIILAHHEKCDGSGYLGFTCEDLPIEAKILAVADVYDALVSDRPYRKGLPPFEAKEIIVKGAGKHFDPKVVEAFVTAFDRGEMDIPNIVV